MLRLVRSCYSDQWQKSVRTASKLQCTKAPFYRWSRQSFLRFIQCRADTAHYTKVYVIQYYTVVCLVFHYQSTQLRWMFLVTSVQVNIIQAISWVYGKKRISLTSNLGKLSAGTRCPQSYSCLHIKRYPKYLATLVPSILGTYSARSSSVHHLVRLFGSGF